MTLASVLLKDKSLVFVLR